MKILVLRGCGSIDTFDSTLESHRQIFEDVNQDLFDEMLALKGLVDINAWLEREEKKIINNRKAMTPLRTSRYFNKCRYNIEGYCEFYNKLIDCKGCIEFHT